MWKMTRPDRALSETFSVVIIALLVLAASILLIASLTGVITNLLQKPALFSVQAIQYNASSDTHIIGLFHQQGDQVNLNGTSQTRGVSIVSLIIIAPDGSQYPISAASATMARDSWGAGDLLYIYKSGSGSYVYSDAGPPGLSSASISPTGTYTVKIIDDKAHTLLHALTVTIR
jgi:hypothetical protein